MLIPNYRKKLGHYGEQIAKRYYRRQGDVVVAENFYCRQGEIDLILLRERVIVFVEVKTRTNDEYGLPEEAVSETKLEHLAGAAEVWVEQRGYQGEFTFEILAIVINRGRVKIWAVTDLIF